ncbi:metallophosphoesterase [Desulfurobacterium sp.]
MKVAIVSDSHDNVEKSRKFVEIVNSMDVGFVVHCGDIISPFTIEIFKKVEAPLTVVFGNNDGEVAGLLKKFPEIRKPPLFMEIDGKKAVVMHEPVLLDVIPGSVDFLFFGHTHEVFVDKIKGTVVINPGELCGYLSNHSTFAILDTVTGEVAVKEI